MSACAPVSFDDLTVRRIESILAVAQEFGVGVPVDEIRTLLPHSPGPLDAELEVGLTTIAPSVKVVDGVAYPSGVEPSELLGAAPSRADQYVERARRLVNRDLASVLPWIRCAGVTGSTAYGHPRDGDDLDLFMVTPVGAVWALLAVTFLRTRLRSRGEDQSRSPEWCINFVAEDSDILAEFRNAHDFHFAREALTVRLVHGEPFYRGLLGDSAWIDGEAPALYERWKGRGWPGSPGSQHAPTLVRVLNLVSFLLLAPYQQLKALARNAHLRGAGRRAECFRVITVPRRFSVLSDRYRRLSAVYSGDR